MDTTIDETYWRDDLDDRPVMVSIHCLTYNHEALIRQTLEGFVTQQTDFRIEAVVHDDASTDGTAAIVREYAERYPSIIKPIIEEENQWKKGTINATMRAHIRGKYVAYCEGDDYWIDPLKLQKQVDFLESHPEYSMCWTDAYRLKRDGSAKPYHRYKQSQDTPVGDIIMKGGLWIPTASIVIRHDVLRDWPPQGVKFHIGDYPLQVHAADMGKVYYLNDLTAVYRYQWENSWTSTAYAKPEQRDRYYANECHMIDGLIKLTGPDLHDYLRQIKSVRLHTQAKKHGDYIKAYRLLKGVEWKYRAKYWKRLFLKALLQYITHPGRAKSTSAEV